MGHRKRGLKGLAIAFGATLVATIGGASPALAVHELGFELDGNTTVQNTAKADWESFFQGDATYNWPGDGTTELSSNAGQLKESAFPLSKGSLTFFDGVFTPDFAGGNKTPDTTTFTQGSKDIHAIKNGDNPWQCAASSNVGGKVNLLNTYATVGLASGQQDWRKNSTTGLPEKDGTSTSTHTFLYYAAEIESANGNHNQGIWLLQDGSVGCSTTGGAQNFSATTGHIDGDLLLAVKLTNGGSKPDSASVVAYRWTGDDATGGLVQLGGGVNIGSVCDAGTTGTVQDLACVITNKSGAITTLWDPGTGGLSSQKFFEGGIDITGIAQGFGKAAPCFANFLTDTRTSQSETSTLFDFTVGRLDTCAKPDVDTQLKKSSDDTNVPTTGVPVGTSVYDTATLSGSVIGTPTGTVTYKLFSKNDCTGTVDSAYINDTTLTDNVVSTVTIASGVIPKSSALTFTHAGTYYWVAYYSGGGPNQANSSACDEEPLVINKVQPGLETDATNPTASIVVGSTVTISDTAKLTGAYSPTGHMTFKLYGPATTGTDGKATACGDLITTISDIDVSGASTSSGDYSFSPTSVGKYYWSASYGGDDNNLSASHAGCELTKTPDSRELVEVVKATPMLGTAMFLGDIATISGGYGTVTGNVTFYLYKDLPANAATPCGASSTLVQSYGPIDLASLKASTVGDLATHLNSYVMESGYIYNWKVAFVDTDGQNIDVTVGCGSSTGAIGSTKTETATPTYAVSVAS